MLSGEPAGLALLKSRCVACHNPQTTQGKLDLTTREAAVRGGERGAAILPGNSRDSLLYQLAAHQLQPAMPPAGNALTPEELKALAAWIDAGASWSEEVRKPASSLFRTAVRPLFEQHCVACHHPGAGKSSGFDLTSREKLLDGGDHGPAISLQDAEASALVARLRHVKTPGMPLNQPQVSGDRVAKVVEWIREGAPYDGPIQVSNLPTKAAGAPHWAFQKPARPPLPKLSKPLAAWSRNPVDAFLAARWQEKGLQPTAEADRRTLLRRLYIDLIGLPPMPADLDSFLSDRSPDAYEKVVDTLLASPRYGERWGRHWMDVWRYADWYGRRALDDQRFSARHIWRWRDWIIESLNSDKGYDQMIREMIAGDELAPNNSNVLRATGYLARNYHRFNRNVWLQDTVEHIGFGILGITLKCARCHDHKYDPLSQEEYYRFRAFFEPYDVRIDRVPGHADTHDGGLARVFDAQPRKGSVEPYFPPIYKETYRFIRGDETNPDKKPLAPGVPAMLGNFAIRIEPVKLNREARIPDLRDFVARDLMEQARQNTADAELGVASSARLLEQARAQLAMRGGAPSQPLKTRKASIAFADIQPILFAKCRQCHGGVSNESRRGGLLLTSEAGAFEGGRRYGPAIVAGNSAASPLIRAIRGEITPKMPPEGTPVTAAELAKLARWIDEMPPEDAAVTVRKAENRLALARKHLDTMRLAIPSLEARLAADRAKYLGADAKENAEELAKAAVQAEHRYALAQAEETVLEAQQLLAVENSAAAKTKLEAAIKALAQGVGTYTPVFEVFPESSTGRRSALAFWLTSRENPLTARVAVNHIWMRHFGKPLVATVSNFGRNGARPTNQPLLDWLAVELMDSSWSMKKIHRLLVTSSAYRMASSGAPLSPSNRQRDPDNQFFWRMNPHRMEAEVVRDAALYLAGSLDLTPGGPDIDEAQALTSHRRSIYLRANPESQAEFLRLFDQPNPTECYVRTESVVPQQALAASNSSLYIEAARALARMLSNRNSGEEEFVQSAFRVVLGAPPNSAEVAESRRFLSEQATLLAEPSRLNLFSDEVLARVRPSSEPRLRARENLVHALLNHNEFVTVR